MNRQPYVLRPYQEEAATAAAEFLASKRTGGGALMVLPTGAGKSLVIAEIARRLDKPVVIFQPSKEILEQNYRKYIDFGLSAGIFSASVGMKRIQRVTFATIGSAINRLEAFRRFPNIIVDECHFCNAKEGMYKTLIDFVGGRVLGLTATPYRLSTDGFGGSILKFLTRTRPRIFGSVIHVTQNRVLFDAGFLARLEYQRGDWFDAAQLRLNTTGADYDDRSVKAYYERIGFGDKLERSVLDCLSAGRKAVLVFTRFVPEATALATKLSGLAEVVSADTPKKERESLLRRFRSGEIKVVANVGVLTTGFDFPELDTIIVARPTMSLALYYQMIGRGIRPHPTKQSAWIVDLCDNYRKFGRVEDLEIVAPEPHRWVVKSGQRQLTNAYFGYDGMPGAPIEEGRPAAVVAPRCPECGSKMVLRETTKFVSRDGSPRRFWGCSKFPSCRGTQGAYPDGRPIIRQEAEKVR